jgi:hypothetical protein
MPASEVLNIFASFFHAKPCTRLCIDFTHLCDFTPLIECLGLNAFFIISAIRTLKSGVSVHARDFALIDFEIDSIRI